MQNQFAVQARAVFYWRVSLIAFHVALLFIPKWQQILTRSHGDATPVFIGIMAVYGLLAYRYAGHPKIGRSLNFVALFLDLCWFVFLIMSSGGLNSPIMGVLPVMSVLFAFLFANRWAAVPTLAVLPIITYYDMIFENDPLFLQLLVVTFYALLSGIALYLVEYARSSHENQNYKIMQLQKRLQELKVLQERSRLSNDIHDGVGAALSGMMIQLEYALTITQHDTPVYSELKELRLSAEEAIDELRRTLTAMNSDFDLVNQIVNLCQSYVNRHRLPLKWQIEGKPQTLSMPQQLAICRLLQESLTNIAKHAQASQIDVLISFTGPAVKMMIQDNGRGFDMSAAHQQHYGLINMKDRARKVGAVLGIQSTPCVGTRILLDLDVKSPEI